MAIAGGPRADAQDISHGDFALLAVPAYPQAYKQGWSAALRHVRKDDRNLVDCAARGKGARGRLNARDLCVSSTT